jgi:hypothetical protein
LDVNSRHGHRYMFGTICRSTGKAFMQPLKKKSNAKGAMQKYLALVRSQCAGIEQRLRLTVKGKEIKVPDIATVYSDRGGEFTTTFGFTRSEFGELFDRRLAQPLHTRHAREWHHADLAPLGKSNGVGAREPLRVGPREAVFFPRHGVCI